MSKQIPQLSLILVNYNTLFWLKKALTSIKEYYLDKTKTRVQVIVVDNNSQDKSCEMIEKNFPWVQLIKLKKNLGFAKANNLALKKIQSPYCMLLNSDIEFNEKSNIDKLIKFFTKKNEIAIITPKLNLTSGKLDMASHRGEPTPWASFTYFLKLEKIFPKCRIFSQYHQLYKNLDQIHEIDACSGAAMLMKTQIIKKINFFDERFFMYAEDLDLCKRIRDKGYQIYFYPEVEITHHKYKSGLKSKSNATVKKINRMFYDTMLQYYDKHYRSKYPGFIRTLIKFFLFIKKGGI